MVKTITCLFIFCVSTTGIFGQNEFVNPQKGDNMPRFPGCEDLATENEKDLCAQNMLLNYVNSQIVYPEKAIRKKAEGKVLIQFVVDTFGMIEKAKILQDIGLGCGDEALRVINSMNNMESKWTPATQDGKKVKVYFTLPINFGLGLDDVKDTKTKLSKQRKAKD